MIAIAKVSTHGKTTVPREIRAALRVEPGDRIVWELAADGSAHVRRATSLDLDYLRTVEATLTEWNGAADEEAYRDL